MTSQQLDHSPGKIALVTNDDDDADADFADNDFSFKATILPGPTVLKVRCNDLTLTKFTSFTSSLSLA